jgi:hypothetical protein
MASGARTHEVQDVVPNRPGEWKKRPTLGADSHASTIKEEWLSILASMTGLLGTSDLVK